MALPFFVFAQNNPKRAPLRSVRLRYECCVSKSWGETTTLRHPSGIWQAMEERKCAKVPKMSKVR